MEEVKVELEPGQLAIQCKLKCYDSDCNNSVEHTLYLSNIALDGDKKRSENRTDILTDLIVRCLEWEPVPTGEGRDRRLVWICPECAMYIP